MHFILELGQNLALLLALTFLCGLVYPRLEKIEPTRRSIIRGLLFGAFSVIGMLIPITLVPGVIIDGRTPMIATATLYGGAISAAITTIIIAITRLIIGGAGAPVGIGSAITIATLSLGVHHYLLRRGVKYPPAKVLLLLGFASAVSGYFWMAQLPGITLEQRLGVFLGTSVLYPLAILLLNKLLESQKRAVETEHALRERERLFRAIFDSSFHDISLLKTDGTLIEINQTALVSTRLERGRVIGRPFWDAFPLMPDESREKLKNAIACAAQGELVAYEVEDWIPDGMTFDITIKPIFGEDGEVALLMSEGRNITERKLNEMALQESERRLRALFDRAFGFVGLLKPDGRLLQANRTILDFFGTTLDNVIGHYLWEVLPNMDEEAQEQIKDSIQRAAQGEFICYETEIVSGERSITVDFSITPLTNENGEIILLIPEGRDISERKRYEAQMLELAVERERSSLMRELIADLSHDLRTPLSVIRLNLEMLQRTTDPEQQARRIVRLLDEEKHLTQLVSDMTEMLRLDGGQAKFTFTRQDVNPLVKQVVAARRATIEDKGLTITLETAPQPLYSAVDAGEFSRAFAALVNNAISFTPAGGSITVTTRSEGDMALVEVRDTGIGIDAKDLPYIFERFFRADDARSVDTGGTGLGLWIVRAILSAHGGSIDTASEPGVGSVFYVRLPLSAEADAETPKPDSPELD